MSKNNKDSINDKLQIFVWGDYYNCGQFLDRVIIHGLETNYEVVACCYDDVWLEETRIEYTIPFISLKELIQKTRGNKNYIVIVLEGNSEKMRNTFVYLKNNGLNNLLTHVLLKSMYRSIPESLESIRNFNLTNSALFVASPLKTGNMTVCNTLKSMKIDFLACEHDPSRVGFFYKYNKIKVITAVREPIAQNLSLIFHEISAPYPNYFNTIAKNVYKDKKTFTSDVKNLSQIFDSYYYKKDELWDMFYVDKFFDSFNKHVLDIYSYPFDTEKGYSIIKKGNVEVFVYQLEKMNDIIEDMSAWIDDVNLDQWVKTNEADAKWISDYYKKTKKEITFAQEYFDDAYNKQWVNHFYSTEDIRKFKDNWRPHII